VPSSACIACDKWVLFSGDRPAPSQRGVGVAHSISCGHGGAVDVCIEVSIKQERGSGRFVHDAIEVSCHVVRAPPCGRVQC
jgi:hypothetical protein